MRQITIKIILFLFFFTVIIFGQFGKNKVQYKDYDWYYIQTEHFDIYFCQNGETLAEFTSKAAENALTSIQQSFNYKINNRITLIIYNSQNDFQETNVIDQYLSEGIEGFTELFKNRVVIQFMGSYKKFRHLVHHELVHAVMNDMFYGGSIQNIISNNITINFPSWFTEGMAEYQSLGWDVDTDMFIRDAAINEYLPDIPKRKDPDEFAKRLTDHKKDGGSYNTSPSISPQGDKVAFLSNRDFYFDLYIMSAIDGKIIKKLIKGNRTADFEELNILTPSLTWSPDGKEIALGAKSGGYDVVYIIEVESEDRETIPLSLEGVKSVTWSPDGKSLAFIGHTAVQSDLYLYNIETQHLDNLTDDLFSDSDPAWSFDGSKIFFSSDRIDKLSKEVLPDSFKIYKHNYNQLDIYSFELSNKKIERITSLPFSDEVSPIASSDGKHLLFISDMNGINNIYKKNLTNKSSVDEKEENQENLEPVTNSLNGLYQLSASKDGKKLSFTSLYQSAFNIFLMNNPFESV